MATYIEREAVEKFIENGLNNPNEAKRFGHDAIEIMAEVHYMPSADVVEVVRCKDCKHYRNHPNGLCYLHTEPKENARGHSGNAVCVETDDFCSYGERTDGGAK